MIRVQNIYYMLAYAFQILHEQGYKDVAVEDFQNTAELLAAILCRGVSVQIKRGLGKQYLTKEEPLSSPRGKIEVSESIKTQAIRKKQLVCAYDEFSVDAYTNRIIKTTMEVLLKANITKGRKKELRKLLIFFDEVSTLDKHNINWNLQYDRNNQTYRMLIAICQLVMKGLLQTNADGTTTVVSQDVTANAVSVLTQLLVPESMKSKDYFVQLQVDGVAYSGNIYQEMQHAEADRDIPVAAYPFGHPSGLPVDWHAWE